MKAVPAALGAKLLEKSEAVFNGELPRLEDVANGVNVSRATLYYYFGGQDDLRGFLIAEHARGGSAVISAADTPEAPAVERLRSVLGALVRHLGERPGLCGALLGALGSAGGASDLEAALRLNDAAIAEPIRRLLTEAAAEGSIAVTDRSAAADTILGGVLFAVLGRSRHAPPDDAFVRHVADQLVRGIATN